jgi:serine/threonine protein kinase/WD40 repeat protein
MLKDSDQPFVVPSDTPEPSARNLTHLWITSMIKTDVCPDPQTLQQYLLGKIHGPERDALDEHFLGCDQCVSSAETIDCNDDFTRCALGAKPPEDEDQEVIQQLIQQIKQARRQMDTLRIGETLAGSPPAASDTAKIKTEMKLDFLAPAQADDELGRLGDYRVLEVIGMGGMGLVLRAEDPKLRRQVALKTMKPSIAERPAAKARFMREAQATAALEHDHIVPIYQVGEDRGVPFIAMQYLKGESLASRLDRNARLSAAEVVRIGKEVASGLALAHEHGMIHRDIKPDNIWLDEKTDRAKILDFGLVSASTDEEGLTHSGAVLGTPRYMSPEQALAKPIDHRCDLFSLGCVLYHCAAGTTPFCGENFTSTLIAVAHQPPIPLEQAAPELHADVAAAIMRLLEKEPDKRPQTAEEVVEQFSELADQLKRVQINLGDTVTQTSGLRPHASQPGGLCDIASGLKPNASNRQPPRRRWPLVAGLGGFAVAFLGILIITIKQPDGTVTTIEVPEGATVQIENKPTGIMADDAQPEQPAVALVSNAEAKEYALEFAGGLGVEIPTLVLPSDAPLTIEATIVFKGDLIPSSSDVRRIAGSSSQFDLYHYEAFDLLMGGNFLEGGIQRAFSPRKIDEYRGRILQLAAVRSKDEIRLFVNGDCVSRTSIAGALVPATNTFNIGALFSGLIDEVRVSNIDRYTDHYVLQRRLVSDEHTLALYHFDEGSGKVLRDSSGNNHHGKIFSGKWIEVEPTKFDKDGPLLFGAKPILVEPGAPLSPRANVQRPNAIPGLRSWSVEAAGLNNPFVDTIAWHPSGDWFTTYEENGNLMVWNAEGHLNQVIFASTRGMSHLQRCATFLDDGNLLATVSRFEYNGKQRIWDTATWKCVRELELPLKFTTTLAWSPLLRRLAFGGFPGIATIDPITGQVWQRNFNGTCYAVDFAPDGNTLVAAIRTVNVPGIPLVWLDAVTLEVLQTVKLENESTGRPTSAHHVAFSPDGNWVACSSSDGFVRIYDGKTAEFKSEFNPGAQVGYSLQWFSDSRRLAVASHGDLLISVWDINQTERPLVKSRPGAVFGMAISPDENEIAYHSYNGRQLNLLNLDSNLNRRFIGNNGVVAFSVPTALSRHGDRVADLFQGVLTIWDSETGQPLQRHGQIPSSHRIDWSPSDKQLALSNRDTSTKNLSLVDARTGQITNLTNHERKIWSTAWSPDGTLLAISGGDHPIEILDPIAGEVLQQLPEESNQSFSLAWSPDGQNLAAWSSSGEIRVWDPKSGIKKAETTDSRDTLRIYLRDRLTDNRIAWYDDNRRLCIALHEHLIVWDAVTKEQLPLEYFSSSSGKPVRGISVAPDHTSSLVSDHGAGAFLRTQDTGEKRYLGVVGCANGWHSDNRRALFLDHFGLSTSTGYDTQTFQKLGTSLRHFPDGGWVVIGPEGHYRGGMLAAPGAPQGDGTTPEELAAIEKHIVYTTLHEDGSRHTYTPAEFRETFNWKNDPNKATLMALPE